MASLDFNIPGQEGSKDNDIQINMLSESDMQTIIMSACSVRHHTDIELANLLNWAENVLMEGVLLGMALKNEIRIEADGNGRRFLPPKEKTFS